ncbi:MAG: prolyl oligopeptidase family serine peptidase [Gemmatimonadetes bacterium]|nr:prolyl oligopeptidase family serine peptidase [Gemmatimonadota bacterium]
MENAIASLVNLPKPTGRMPFHLSPDGRLLALGVQRRIQGARGPRFDEWGVPTEMAGSSVVVVGTATGESMQPFPEDSVSWGAQWSPTGDRLVACVRHEGVACLGLWDVGTGEVELLRNAPVLVRFGFDLPVWTPDGEGIVVPLWPADRDYREDAHGPVPKIDVRSNDPDATTEVEPALPSRRLCDLGHISLSTGSVKRLLQQWASGHWHIAPDGRHVACTRYVEGVTSLQYSLFELSTVDIETGVERVLASDIASAFGINYAWSPDSANVAYTSFGRDRPDELFVVAADGSKEPVNLTPGPEFDLLLKYDTPRWSPDSSKLHSLGSKAWWQFDLESGQHRCASIPEEWSMRHWIARPTEPTIQLTPAGGLPVVLQNRSDLSEQVAHLGQDGELKHVADIPGTCTGQIWCMEVDDSSGCYYLMAEEAKRPPSVLRIEDRSHDWLFCLAPEVQVSKLGRSELIDFEAAGMQCRGVMLLPPETRPPHPMIVSVYGGYRGVGTINRFSLQGPQAIEPQLLCSAGYAVLFPEVPLGEKDPMTGLVEPVLNSVDRAVELGLADGSRVGLMGTSYGGYSTVALIAQTDRFRAALAIAPWGVNMTSFYSHHIGWCETGQARLGGSPWENRAAYIENSPFFYLDQVSTPLLLVCGTGDRDGSNQAEETFVALRRLGKRVELRLYKDEHHGTSAWSRDALDDLCRRVLDWFNCHVAEAQPHEELV